MIRLRLAPSVALFCLTSACAQGYLPVEPPNVLLIVVDTLRKSELGTYGYPRPTSPNIDRLAEQGVRYEWAFSQAAWTTPSIASLLTSRYPSQLGIAGELTPLADEFQLLSEALRASGYVTGAVVSHAFCSAKWNFDQGFDVFDQSNLGGHSAVRSAGVTERAIKFLEREREQPFFLWLHYFDPHVAYIEHEGFRFDTDEGYDGPVASGMEVKWLRELERQGGLRRQDVERARALYDSEVAFTDHHIGRVLEWLRSRDLFDNTFILLTADHGEAFMEHGKLGHATSLYNELVNVPLIVKFPSRLASTGAEHVIREAVSLIDLFPTVLEVAEITWPEPLEGTPLPRRSSLETRSVFIENARAFQGEAVVDRNFKLIHETGTDRYQLYDLRADPEEQHELLERGENAEFARLLGLLEAWRGRMEAVSVESQEILVSAEERERLKSLGYLGD